MTNNTSGINTAIKVNGQKLETVTSFKYLGSVMIDEGSKPVLLQILNDILTAVDDDKISILLLLDLSAAFDTIDHEILLSCLEHDFGIRSTALNWFQSHLSDRKQYDLVDSQKQTKTSLDFVFGPILFIMYTTPLTAVIEKHCIRHEMFADDTQLSHSESPDNYSDMACSLQNCVKDIGVWM